MSPAPPGRLRVATFNIRHGAPPQVGADHRGLAEACAALRADVLAIQEVDVRARRSGFVDQSRLVARATGMRVAFAPAVRRHLVRRYGNALLVRGAISDVDVLALPELGSGEPRVALLATAELDGWRLSVASTHLSFKLGEGPPQLEAVSRALMARPAPRLLLGDLNLEAEVVESLLGPAGWAVADVPPAFPARRPRRRIDHVAVDGLRVLSVEAPEAPVSDHRPVVAVVALEVEGRPQAKPE